MRANIVEVNGRDIEVTRIDNDVKRIKMKSKRNILVIFSNDYGYLVLEYDDNNILIDEKKLENVKHYGDVFGGFYKGDFIELKA